MKSNGMTSKLTVATELLDRALYLYFEGNSYFASLNLAGVAEEILGAYITHNGGVSSFTSMRDGAVRLSKHIDESGIASKQGDISDLMNHAKNSTKHMNNLNDSLISFDAKYEAEAMLERAVSNYYFLMAHSAFGLEITELISRFNARLSA